MSNSMEPLLQNQQLPSGQQNSSSAEATQQEQKPRRRTLATFCYLVETTLDWLPFIATQFLNGAFSPVFALGCGTAAAALVLVVQLFKNLFVGAVFPKILDIGQFLLFGLLWVFSFVVVSQNGETAGKLLVLWFNSVTTAGMGFIMWASVLRGHSFVLDYAEATMPPFVFKKLSSRKWFLDILDKVAMFWVKILFTMALVVSIQPLLVTTLYEGDVNKDASGFMTTLGNCLNLGQLGIMFYGIRTSMKKSRDKEAIKRRVREVKDSGGACLDQGLYGGPVEVVVQQINGDRHRIRSLKSAEDLQHASRVLADAFRGSELMKGFQETVEGKYNFLKANCNCFSYFNQVLGCCPENLAASPPGLNSASSELAPRAVMACIPVLSCSQEEIEAFNSYEAWVEHGFQSTDNNSDPYDFPLPDDDLMALGQMRKNPKHGLTKQPYIYIAYFGVDSSYKGHGYGRSLLQHIVKVSEEKKLALVLETTNAFNISHYEKYGFRVVEAIKGRADWVLMIRGAGQE